MGMLREFLDRDYVRFEQGGVHWEEAIRVAAQNFVDKDIVDESYVEEIIACVKEFGPYIVLIPEVAMPHSSQNSSGCKGTGISFTKFDSPIVFDENDEEKNARLFFTLAAKDDDAHMNNISELSELLMNEEILEALLAVESVSDFEKVVEKYDE